METLGTPFVCTYGSDGKTPLELMPDPPKDVDRSFAPAGRLIDPEKAEDIEAKVGSKYLKAFPMLEGRYSFHLCESADGVEL